MSPYDYHKLGLDDPDQDIPDCQWCFDRGCEICENYPDVTCSHNEKLGLTRMCSQCRKDYDIDDSYWMEFGSHKEGVERWNEFLGKLEKLKLNIPFLKWRK
jgi:hypothetical protein